MPSPTSAGGAAGGAVLASGADASAMTANAGASWSVAFAEVDVMALAAALLGPVGLNPTFFTVDSEEEDAAGLERDEALLAAGVDILLDGGEPLVTS